MGILGWHFNWEQVFLPDCPTPCCWIHVSDSLVQPILTLKINVQRVKLGSIWCWWKWLDLDANYTTDRHCLWCKLPPTTQIKSFQWKSIIQWDNDLFSSLDYCLLWHIFSHENFSLLLKIWIRLQFFLAQIVYLFQTTYLLCHIQSWNE
jgi:hypothetical protein